MVDGATLTARAEAGDVDAMWALAEALIKEGATIVDDLRKKRLSTQAMTWTRRAAEGGHLDAMAITAEGLLGVSPKAAVEMLRAAADRGHAGAMELLAIIGGPAIPATAESGRP